MKKFAVRCVAVAFATLSGFSAAQAQFGPPPPRFVSPEVTAEKKIAFRIHAPKAQEVRLSSSDLPDLGRGVEMTKGENGVWEATVGPVPPGAYRYNFSVDGLSVIDPRNPITSESNANTWSLVYVPGSETFDLKDVPHGAVAEVTYHSKTLDKFRRLHVYTPPGYEKGSETYPVFYLLHGAFDGDNSWSTVGRAGFILDNLIAAGKAKPMVVVMPTGHTGPFSFGPPGAGGGFEKQMSDFVDDFTKEIRPLVEKTYRVGSDRANRAIAGLSMGGAQTLNIAFTQPEDYGYVGVFSSGIFGIAGGPNAEPSTKWEDDHRSVLDSANTRKGLNLVWFGCGNEDFLVETANKTVEMLKGHGIDVTYKRTGGGHTWSNWRDYLAEFAPLLFTDAPK